MSAETPLVHRTVRTGGMLLVVASLQFVVALVLTASHVPGLDASTPTVTALTGAAAPWSTVFAASLVVLGLVAFFGLLLSWSAFDSRPSRGVGLLLLAAGAVAALAVGLFASVFTSVAASTVRYTAYGALGLAGIGFLVLPFAMHRQERWRASRFYTFLSGLVVLVTGGVYLAHAVFGLGNGGVPAVALAVALLWPIVEGAHIALLHRFAPGLHVKVAAA